MIDIISCTSNPQILSTDIVPMQHAGLRHTKFLIWIEVNSAYTGGTAVKSQLWIVHRVLQDTWSGRWHLNRHSFHANGYAPMRQFWTGGFSGCTLIAAWL
jgi:hypothetical protein